MHETWRLFCAKFDALWCRHDEQAVQSSAPRRRASSNASERRAYLEQLFVESVGYAACCMIRLIIGMHHFPPLEAVRDTDVRVAAERQALALARRMLLTRGTPQLLCMDQLVGAVLASTASSSRHH